MSAAAVLHAALFVFLVFVFPIWDRREVRRLKAATDPRARIQSYQITIAWQLVVVAILLATVPATRLFAPPWGMERFGVDASSRLAFGLVLGLLAGAALPVFLAMRDPEARRKMQAGMEKLDFFLPHTREARLWWAALSVSVGVCEEIIFRGWLIPYLEGVAPWLGPAGAILAAALIFGIDHGYQGWTGIVATGVLALVFTALFIVSGTLWVPIAVHVLIDLRLLLLLDRAEG